MGRTKLGLSWKNFLFLDPVSYYVLMVILVVGCVILVHNLYNSRFGRAWVAIREDERAAAAMGLNPVSIKLLAFAIGASLSGFAGCYYAAKLSLVDPTEFSFVVSVTVLIMVALGGMGSIPGVIAGALLLYYFEFNLLPGLPQMAVTVAGDLGLGYLKSAARWLARPCQRGRECRVSLFWANPAPHHALRPEGLIPSALRRQELAGDRAFRSRQKAKKALPGRSGGSVS